MRIDHFPHKPGHHCISTTTRDLVEHAGIGLSEEMVFGLEGSLGFVYFDRSAESNMYRESMDIPLMIGGLGGIISEDSLLCKVLGLVLSMEYHSGAEEGWTAAKKLLDQGMPLGIQVEMAFLPYLWTKGDEPFYFGGHVISLVGYDETQGIAYVCDTEEKSAIVISIDDLKRARNSKEGSKWLRPKNMQYTISLRPDGKKPPFGRAAKLSIQKVVKNMLGASMNYEGIQGLHLLARSIPSWKSNLTGTVQNAITGTKVSTCLLAFEMLHGFIEEYGTGGGLFRNMYGRFLDELSVHPDITSGPHAWSPDELARLVLASESIQRSATLWTQFATVVKETVDCYQEECIGHVDSDTLVGIVNNIISKEETCFNTLRGIKL